jgi:hypothetical protein
VGLIGEQRFLSFTWIPSKRITMSSGLSTLAAVAHGLMLRTSTPDRANRGCHSVTNISSIMSACRGK